MTNRAIDWDMVAFIVALIQFWTDLNISVYISLSYFEFASDFKRVLSAIRMNLVSFTVKGIWWISLASFAILVQQCRAHIQNWNQFSLKLKWGVTRYMCAADVLLARENLSFCIANVKQIFTQFLWLCSCIHCCKMNRTKLDMETA